MRGGSQATIELITNRADSENPHYVARTVEGAGAPSEIWTSLDPNSTDQTGIRVEFCVAPMPEEALRKLGKGMIGLYTLLWTQDEAMMQARTLALASRDSRSGDGAGVRDGADFEVGAATGQPGETIVLGKVDELRSRVPLVVELSGHSFRIVEVEGKFVAHSTECPHRLGPLGECEVESGRLVCPWHGYAFDLRSGRSADGHRLRLRPAPEVVVDSEQRVLVVPLTNEHIRDLETSGSKDGHEPS